MAREHPLGVAWHPEWEAVERRQAALRVAERRSRVPNPKPPLIDRIRIWVGECFG